MSTLTKAFATAAITVSLGVLAAPTAMAASTQPAPVNQGGGSIGICFTVPMPGSAALVWCL